MFHSVGFDWVNYRYICCKDVIQSASVRQIQGRIFYLAWGCIVYWSLGCICWFNVCWCVWWVSVVALVFGYIDIVFADVWVVVHAFCIERFCKKRKIEVIFQFYNIVFICCIIGRYCATKAEIFFFVLFKSNLKKIYIILHTVCIPKKAKIRFYSHILWLMNMRLLSIDTEKLIWHKHHNVPYKPVAGFQWSYYKQMFLNHCVNLSICPVISIQPAEPGSVPPWIEKLSRPYTLFPLDGSNQTREMPQESSCHSNCGHIKNVSITRMYANVKISHTIIPNIGTNRNFHLYRLIVWLAISTNVIPNKIIQIWSISIKQLWLQRKYSKPSHLLTLKSPRKSFIKNNSILKDKTPAMKLIICMILWQSNLVHVFLATV